MNLPEEDDSQKGNSVDNNAYYWHQEQYFQYYPIPFSATSQASSHQLSYPAYSANFPYLSVPLHFNVEQYPTGNTGNTDYSWRNNNIRTVNASNNTVLTEPSTSNDNQQASTSKISSNRSRYSSDRRNNDDYRTSQRSRDSYRKTSRRSDDDRRYSDRSKSSRHHDDNRLKYSHRSNDDNSRNSNRSEDDRNCSRRYDDNNRKISRYRDDRSSSKSDHDEKQHTPTNRSDDEIESLPRSYKRSINEELTTDESLSKRYKKKEMDRILKTNFKNIIFSKSKQYYQNLDSVKITATDDLIKLRQKFIDKTLKRAQIEKMKLEPFSFPVKPVRLHAHKHNHKSDESCSSESESDEEEGRLSQSAAFRQLEMKKTHPYRLNDEIWYNDRGELNDGPLCRCSINARKSGIRHGIYPGEERLSPCDLNSNNCDKLFHYKIKIEPTTNFHLSNPTIIQHNGQNFFFEGYSFFSHYEIVKSIPSCKIVRFNIEYKITFEEEQFPTNFCIGDVDAFFDYVFYDLIELVDIDFGRSGPDGGCRRFHFLPRFVHFPGEDTKIILPMSIVLDYLTKQSKPMIEEDRLGDYDQMSTIQWSKFVDQFRSKLITKPTVKPSTIRVDQIDRDNDKVGYPVIVHFGVRPPQLSYAGNPKYQRAWREYCKYRHLLANKDKLSSEDRKTLKEKEETLREIRSKSDLKRDVTVVVSSEGFYTTGLNPDVVQHSLFVPVLISHIRFHFSLLHLESSIGYTFKDRSLLQLCLTHPSYRENFGTNPDHVRNTLTNCGLRYLEFGDRKVHFDKARKRGINMLINIMSRMGCNEETASQISHNERLEFLGDAVVEFLSTIHLYFMFSDLEEGGLATFRAALVQNQNLATLAKKLQLEKFMLYAHGSDLCHDIELRHAMANCFEAFMGALFLDGGIEIADRIFSSTLWNESSEFYSIWNDYSKHPLQIQYPTGDRHLVDEIPRLKAITKFEETIGVRFKHIRLLARAFSHRSVGFNNLTLGSNQRMEFLGDTVLQLISSEYLYKFFPDHHEGHLSLLRSSLVNNKTQSVVCDDLGIVKFTHYNKIKAELKIKDKADLLEAFIGALYVDQGLKFCRRFCEVCFFPRLPYFIIHQDWNDPKSKLQQCCLTLRKAEGGEPDIPSYKVIESKGPTNTRIYVVAVYFRDKRLSTGSGHSIQEAEMNAARNALVSSKNLFPHLEHQKKVIERNSRWNAAIPCSISSGNEQTNSYSRTSSSSVSVPSTSVRAENLQSFSATAASSITFSGSSGESLKSLSCSATITTTESIISSNSGLSSRTYRSKHK